jgi:hypothetical protein
MSKALRLMQTRTYPNSKPNPVECLIAAGELDEGRDQTAHDRMERPVEIAANLRETK